MGQVIIVVWGWYFRKDKIKEYFSKNDISKFCINIDENKNKKLIGFTRRGENKEGYKGYKTKYTESDIIKEYNYALKKKNKVLLLLHENENKSGRKIVTGIKENLDKNPIKGLTIDTFGGGNNKDNIEIYEVLLTSSGYNLVPNNEEELKNAFDKVWQNFSISKIVKNYEQLKTEFIKLWLPIAIDMQGLYEVKEKQKDKDRFDEYLGKINNSYKKHFKQINSFHKENEEYFQDIFDIKEVSEYIIDNKGFLTYYPEFPKIFEDALKKFDKKIK